MFKSLYKETEGFRLVSILTPLCMIGEVVMEMIIPKLMSSIIDDGVTAGNLSHIYRIGGWMIVAAAFGLLFGVLGGVFGARASTGYARNLRRSMYRNIQTFSFANIDKYSTAGLVTRMTTDVTNIQNAYQMILRMAIRAPSSMVIAMIMAFTINANPVAVSTKPGNSAAQRRPAGLPSAMTHRGMVPMMSVGTSVPASRIASTRNQ